MEGKNDKQNGNQDYQVKLDEECIHIMELYHNGQEKLAKEMIISKLGGYVGRMVETYFKSYKKEYYYDFYNEGCVAILEKMSLFDPYKGSATTFFTPYIHHYMCKLAGKISNKSSPYHSERMNKVKKAINTLEMDNQGEYGITDVSLMTGLPVDKVDQIMERIARSSEVLCGASEDYDAVVTHKMESMEAGYLKREMSENLAEALLRLDKLDRGILIHKLGLNDNPSNGRKTAGMSYAAIAANFHIPINQVRVRYQRALRALAHDPEVAQYNFGRVKRAKKAKTAVKLLYADCGACEALYEQLDGMASGVDKKENDGEEPFLLTF